MLCVVPLLRALRSTYPRARLVLMTSMVNHEVMEGNRFLDDTILFDKRDFLGKRTLHIRALLTYIRQLRERAFDTVIVPATVSMSFTSDLFAFLSGAGRRIGPARLNGIPNPSGFVYTEKETLDWRGQNGRHQTERNLDIVAGKGIDTDDLTCEITLRPEEREAARQRFGELRARGYVLIAYHPGGGKGGEPVARREVCLCSESPRSSMERQNDYHLWPDGRGAEAIDDIFLRLYLSTY